MPEAGGHLNGDRVGGIGIAADGEGRVVGSAHRHAVHIPLIAVSMAGRTCNGRESAGTAGAADVLVGTGADGINGGGAGSGAVSCKAFGRIGAALIAELLRDTAAAIENKESGGAGLDGIGVVLVQAYVEFEVIGIGILEGIVEVDIVTLIGGAQGILVHHHDGDVTAAVAGVGLEHFDIFAGVGGIFRGLKER